MTRREEAKARRRAAIIAAARSLIKEGDTEKGELSMRRLAARAAVSVTTVYNLFGSKQALMIGVLNDDHTAYREWFGRVRSPDPIERFFDAIVLAKQLYASEPNFYKSVQFSVYNGYARELRLALLGPRHSFLEDLVREAVHLGAIDTSVNIAAFGNHLNSIFRWAVLSWALSDVSLDQLEAEIGYGFCAALLPLVGGGDAEILKAKMAGYAVHVAPTLDSTTRVSNRILTPA